MTDFDNKLINCGSVGVAFDDTKLTGYMGIKDLLQKPYDKHISDFEIPVGLRDLFDASTVNTIITWYLNWKLIEHIDRQNTCTIKEIFGYNDGTIIIIAINLYKYLRHKAYDPEIIGKFVKL